MADNSIDEYNLWCECHPCPACDGLGEDLEQGYGAALACGNCDGSGIDPNAGYD